MQDGAILASFTTRSFLKKYQPVHPSPASSRLLHLFKSFWGGAKLQSYFTTTQSETFTEPFTGALELCLGSWHSLSSSLKSVSYDSSSDSISISKSSSDSLSCSPSDSVSFSVETDISFPGAKKV